MRTTKYRVWDKEKKVMIDYYQIVSINFDKDGVCGIDGWIPIKNGDEWEQELYQIDKQNIVLMQWTGLTDKNGKDIYEGDVVKYEETVLLNGELVDGKVPIEKPHIVTEIKENYEYWDGKIGTQIWGHILISVNDLFGLHQDEWSSYYGYESAEGLQEGEVIGNVFQNPELLEQ